MVINPSILKNIKQISFTAQEPKSTKVLWAKPEDGLFAFYLFINDKWEHVESSANIELPTVSVYLSGFINDVGYLTEESIKECDNIIGSRQLESSNVATDSDIEKLF